MKNDEVIVIVGNTVLRISPIAYKMVMDAAGQMRDDWFEVYLQTYKNREVNSGFNALVDMTNLAMKGITS